MAENRKYLFGKGEQLSYNVDVTRSGGSKNPPYTYDETIQRTSSFLNAVIEAFDALPDQACPRGRAVASVSIHPRFISKSDFPTELFRSAGVHAIGGKTENVIPTAWGINDPPESAVTDTYYVAGEREAFRQWSRNIRHWNPESNEVQQLQTIEKIYVPTRAERFKNQSYVDSGPGVYEVVLHSEDDESILDTFYSFAEKNQIVPIKNRVRFAGNVIFVPVEAQESSSIDEIADFSFLRAVRKMPALRTFRPPVLRSDFVSIPKLPDQGKFLDEKRIAIFDGGVSDNSPLLPWINRIDPVSIGAPINDALAHGEQVTSAFLFGHLTPETEVKPPYSIVDHIRVIDADSGANSDYELYDVLNRILSQLDSVTEPYELVNLSLGPDLPIEDDDITAWTAELDQRASSGQTLFVSAAGNSGYRDATAKLNRIQPPSDGVNLLAVGACTSPNQDWERCGYSSIGPGRTPGVAKPDGVAFGGCFDHPFGVIDSLNQVGLCGTYGTSFSAPLVLRSAAGLSTLTRSELQPLAIRALLVHTSEASTAPQQEIGWGRFLSDPLEIISCEDTEITILYQGELPLKQFLRAPIPIGDVDLSGNVELTATLVIAPEVDPAFANAYTRAGLEVVFRPNINKIKNERQAHATSESFFSDKNLYKAAEYKLRADGHKWEPCLKAKRTKRGNTLSSPCFDIYYHTRHEARTDEDANPIPYVFIVTLKAHAVSNLYDATLEAYSEILSPIEPLIDISAN